MSCARSPWADLLVISAWGPTRQTSLAPSSGHSDSRCSPVFPDRCSVGAASNHLLPLASNPVLLRCGIAMAKPAIQQARHQAEVLSGPDRRTLAAPECRRRLESPPSLAQRFRHRNLVTGLPAGHGADSEVKRGPIVLPDGTEQSAAICDVARAPQTFLEPCEPHHVALGGRIACVKWQEGIRPT